RGGTELLPALEDVLSLPADPERSRMIVLLTDGAVSAEEQAAALIRRGLSERVRLFCFGIGPAVNRYLLNRLARLGRGTAEVVGLNEDIEGAIIRFQDRLSYPVLTDLQLAVIGADLLEVLPSPLPDLYAGQVLSVIARLKCGGQPELTRVALTGRRGSEPIKIEIEAARPTDEPLIRRLWGQRVIDRLLEAPACERNEVEITKLSLAHHILTPYTALLAIDCITTDAVQPPRRVFVATPLPEGLQYASFGVSANLVRRRSPLWASLTARSAPPVQDGLSNHGQHLFTSAGPDHGLQDRSAMYGAINQAESTPVIDLAEGELRRLARQQRVSGAWGEDHESVEETAAAVVAFARAGYTPTRGSFRQAMSRALRWLQSAPRTGIERVLVLWALGEVAVADGKTEAFANLAKEAMTVGATTPSPLVAAIAVRLERLSGKAIETGEVSATNDYRVAAILGQVPNTDIAQLSTAWQACLAAVTSAHFRR
ncbi:MAG TPA: hypothetical protein VKX96_08365, partial [Chloroflexota bacterium]|nr:hypothetical protein [Chloroflexota bacterium]